MIKSVMVYINIYNAFHDSSGIINRLDLVRQDKEWLDKIIRVGIIIFGLMVEIQDVTSMDNSFITEGLSLGLKGGGR